MIRTTPRLQGSPSRTQAQSSARPAGRMPRAFSTPRPRPRPGLHGAQSSGKDFTCLRRLLHDHRLGEFITFLVNYVSKH